VALGRFEEALAAYRAAEGALQGRSALASDVAQALARLFRQRGEVEEAERAFLRAFDGNTDNDQARLEYADFLYRERHAPARALEELDRIARARYQEEVAALRQEIEGAEEKPE
jgi:uncharacterized protein (TIGR02996 family)